MIRIKKSRTIVCAILSFLMTFILFSQILVQAQDNMGIYLISMHM